jgi:hypothetical protein
MQDRVFGVLYGRIRTTELKDLLSCPLGGDRRWHANLVGAQNRDALVDWTYEQRPHYCLRMTNVQKAGDMFISPMTSNG